MAQHSLSRKQGRGSSYAEGRVSLSRAGASDGFAQWKAGWCLYIEPERVNANIPYDSCPQATGHDRRQQAIVDDAGCPTAR